jgi:hypothetical protein
MPGMPMAIPETTMTLCVEKGAEKDPQQMVKKDSGCEITDIKTSGNKTSWKMHCKKDGDEMTGSGDVTHQTGSYQGTTKLSGKSHGHPINMTANFNGKRIGTACDTSNSTVTVKGMENMNEMMGMAKSQMASAMAEQCEVSNFQTTELISNRFFGANAACPGKEKFACKLISKDASKKQDVYIKLAKHDDTSDVSIAKTCGIDMTSATKAICKTVDSGNYQELADYCPNEAKAFADAGRSYTSTTRSTSLIPSNPVGTAIDGARKLKGLFGY